MHTTDDDMRQLFAQLIDDDVAPPAGLAVAARGRARSIQWRRRAGLVITTSTVLACGLLVSGGVLATGWQTGSREAVQPAEQARVVDMDTKRARIGSGLLGPAFRVESVSPFTGVGPRGVVKDVGTQVTYVSSSARVRVVWTLIAKDQRKASRNPALPSSTIPPRLSRMFDESGGETVRLVAGPRLLLINERVRQPGSKQLPFDNSALWGIALSLLKDSSWAVLAN
jgi:hypothetical protein